MSNNASSRGHAGVISERFQAIRNFKPFDRLPVIEWAGYWNKTLERWKQEGLPDEVLVDGEPVAVKIYEYLGMDRLRSAVGPFFPIPSEVREAMGSIIGKPNVESEADYEKLLPRIYPEVDAEAALAAITAGCGADDERISRYDLVGFFWWPRLLFGIEPHFYAFYDHPELMHRMNSELCEFNIRQVRAIANVCTPDFMTIREDMSYNHGPMLSREMFDSFLLPYYQRLTAEIRAQGTAIFVDSDGDVNDLAGWLLDAGVEGLLPLERQAGTDVNLLRKKHPGILLMGGFDKMTMYRGEAAMRSEFERLLPAARAGGFVISVDHQTPPISWHDYQLFIKLFKEYAVKAAKK